MKFVGVLPAVLVMMALISWKLLRTIRRSSRWP